MAYTIAEPCIGVKDKSCVAACPVDCIHEGETMLYIDPITCIDCGACEAVCPVQAISPNDSVPEKWKFYSEINKNFFPDKTDAKAWEGHTLPTKS